MVLLGNVDTPLHRRCRHQLDLVARGMKPMTSEFVSNHILRLINKPKQDLYLPRIVKWWLMLNYIFPTSAEMISKIAARFFNKYYDE